MFCLLKMRLRSAKSALCGLMGSCWDHGRMGLSMFFVCLASHDCTWLCSTSLSSRFTWRGWAGALCPLQGCVVCVYSYCALHVRVGAKAVWCGVLMEKAGPRCFSKREVKRLEVSWCNV